MRVSQIDQCFYNGLGDVLNLGWSSALLSPLLGNGLGGSHLNSAVGSLAVVEKSKFIELTLKFLQILGTILWQKPLLKGQMKAIGLAFCLRTTLSMELLFSAWFAMLKCLHMRLSDQIKAQRHLISGSSTRPIVQHDIAVSTIG